MSTSSELKRERKEKKKRKREQKEKDETELRQPKEERSNHAIEQNGIDTLNDKEKKKKRKRDKSDRQVSQEGNGEGNNTEELKSDKKKKKKKRKEEEDEDDKKPTNGEQPSAEKKKKRQREEASNGSKPKRLSDDQQEDLKSKLRKEKQDDEPSTTPITEKKTKKPKSEKDTAVSSPKKVSTTTMNGTATSMELDHHHQHQCHRRPFPVDYQYILAPMVGASELPFRLLCRKYGTQLCYTPMMSSTQFAHDAAYRQTEFLGQVTPEDRPLVCHFSANDPHDFEQAAKLVEPYCDAIDLNLGCPQRTAYVGHFGSYLLDPVDRALVLQIVAAGAKAVSIPICCKIRLLNTLEETIELCQQLQQAGAGLIAIHARYRASWERTGPGARDGPALLDQVTEIRKRVPDIPIIANGNTKTFDDVIQNLELTQADGLMSAEGILDNPALFLPRLGAKEDDGDKLLTVMAPLTAPAVQATNPMPASNQQELSLHAPSEAEQKKRKRLTKKLREIERIEEKMQADGEGSINQDQKEKLATKSVVEMQLSELDHPAAATTCNGGAPKTEASLSTPATTEVVTLRELYEVAEDKLLLAKEYLSLVRRFPTKIRTVIFHTRRMLRSMLEQYQLLEDLLVATCVNEVDVILDKCLEYRDNPQFFEYDRDKAKRQREALEKRRHEEGKRKAFEARMMRKAKREGKTDLSYYLRQGSQVPTAETVAKLKKMSKEEQLSQWKVLDHSQHCLAFHLDPNGCKRDRACAFLHVETKGANAFDESDEVAG